MRPLSVELLAASFASQSHGVQHWVRTHIFDTTFRGLYHANAFDLCLLIPYFIVLIILAGYGMHRYQLVWMYYRNRRNKTTEPEHRFADLPRVTVQLPIFNEQYVVDRLVDSICKLDYPKDKLDIQVLDDSTDETVEVARRSWNVTPRWVTPSLISTARIAKASKRAPCRRA